VVVVFFNVPTATVLQYRIVVNYVLTCADL
jgi:hypothetical protein